MLVDPVITRLRDQGVCPRVEGASELQALIDRKGLPSVSAAAFVLPLGLRGGQVQSATGLFVQSVDEIVGVCLVLRDASSDGARARDSASALIEAAIAALAGWQAPGQPDTFHLGQGGITNFQAGVLIYQLQFATTYQLRIAP